MRSYLIISLLIASLAYGWHLNKPVAIIERDILFADEWFEYEVRYGFLNLGTVVVSTADTVINGKEHRHIKTVMISNNRLPFVGYKEYHYHAAMAVEDTSIYTSRFWVDKIHRDHYPFNYYDFDYGLSKIYSFEMEDKRDTLDLPGITYAGPELFQLSRLGAGRTFRETYRIVIDNEIQEIFVEYTGETQMLRSSAFEGDRIEVLNSSGTTILKGPFGFSGDFRAFHKNDAMRLPIEARLSVWIGNVVVRLVDYKKLE